MEPLREPQRCPGAPEATMKRLINQDRLILETFAALIARSPIMVASLGRAETRLPAGYDHVDASILNWIAAEGRRAGRNFTRV
jgi:hypothetical protein